MNCKVCGNEKVHCKGMCQKCYTKEYNQRPDVKAKQREYQHSPKRKQYRIDYNQRVEIKAKHKEYNRRPEVMEYQKEYMQRPDVRERNRIKNRLKTLERKYVCEFRPTRIQRQIELLNKMLGEM